MHLFEKRKHSARPRGNFLLNRLGGSRHLLSQFALSGKQVTELLVWRRREFVVAPELRREVGVGAEDGTERGLHEVAERPGGTARRRVDVLETSEGKELLGHAGSDDSGSTWGRHQSDTDGAALASHLAGDSVRLAELGAPPSTTDRHNRELGEDDGTTNSGGDFLRALHAKTDVTIAEERRVSMEATTAIGWSLLVSDTDEGLESSALSSAGLLLNGRDLHDLVLEGLTEKLLDNLVLLDRHGEAVDLLKRTNLVGGDKSSKLGDGDPLLLITTSTASATTSTSTAASSSTTTTVIAESTAETATALAAKLSLTTGRGWHVLLFSHIVYVLEIETHAGTRGLGSDYGLGASCDPARRSLSAPTHP